MGHYLYPSDAARGTSGEVQGSKPQAEGASHWTTRLPWSPEPELDSLNRALVVGLMLEVILENPRLAEGSGSRRHQVKAHLRSNLACQLAGRIPLASFQSLVQVLDHWFEIFYPVLAEAGLSRHSTSLAKVFSPSVVCPLREDLFRECLENNPGLLPTRRHRKCDPEKLQNFLETTEGKWFRLRDFEEHFQMDRKTAWEYAQKLLQAGLLVHNQGHSSAVRYRVEPRFLRPGRTSPADHAGPPVPGNTSLS
jgi:hypothetical protein